MSTYHLQARVFEGSLADPRRDELRSRQSDDRAEIMGLAEDLATRGFSVWVYEHGPVKMANGEGAYRVIAEWGSHGRQVR